MSKFVYDTDDLVEFIDHSNYIENERSFDAFDDAMKAWKYIEKFDVLTFKEVKNVHKILMQRLRPEIAGKWRACDVYIGGHRKPYISQTLFNDQVQHVCDLMMKPSSMFEYPDLYTKKIHVEFEFIHPFEDGNGRVGRILYNWHRLMYGLPIHVIHEGEEQLQYYKWFR